jgi:hypothetical protein
MILYYQEGDGDYVAVESESHGREQFEGRATAIAGLASSVCTTAISREFLRRSCKRVGKARVPAAWRKAIGH